MLLFIHESLGYANEELNDKLVGHSWKQIGF